MTEPTTLVDLPRLASPRFPYEILLAFYRGQLDAQGSLAVKQNLEQSPRWRAHLHSIRSLDLERAAARQDGISLQAFDIALATPFCREVARTLGDVLWQFLQRAHEEALGEGRSSWDRHVNRCVYCRRMRRLMQARFVKLTHEIPESEDLLREWLLKPYYLDALNAVTQRLAPERLRRSESEDSPSLQEETVLELRTRKGATGEEEADTVVSGPGIRPSAIPGTGVPIEAAAVDSAEGHREVGDLEAARTSYQEALDSYRTLAKQRPEVYRPCVAGILNNLGNVQSDLNDLEAARTSFQEALDIRRELAKQRPEVYRPLVATTLNNLGNVQSDLNDLEAARDSFLEAVCLYANDAAERPSARLVERQKSWNNLGRLYLTEAPALDWPDRHAARDAFREARHCAEQFRGRFRDSRQRSRVQGEALHVYESLVGVSVDLWHIYADLPALHEAVEVAEASRARNLTELLAEEVLSPAGAPFNLVEKFRVWRRQLRAARERLVDGESHPLAAPFAEETATATATTSSARAPFGEDAPRPAPPPKRPIDDLRREFEETERSYLDVLRRLRIDDDTFDPDRPVPPITFAQARDLIPTDVPTAFVQYTLTQERGLAIVLTGDDAFAVTLPDFKDAEAWMLANEWYRSYYGGHRAAWEAALPGLLEEVAARAVRPVMEKLAGRGLQRLVLSPNRALHVFPLHACPLADGRPLTDHVEVAYTPSLSILHRCAGRPRPTPTRLVLAENPTGDLAYTEVEGAGLRHLYAERTVRRRREVTKEDLLNEASKSHILHYSGHATFDFDEPLNSALVLEGQHPAMRSHWLTLRDVFTQLHLRDNTLTVLNGCESGMVRLERVDEVVGLATGFLFAGAACVVSTLWAVYDLSSALLALRFHELWLKGQTPAAALRAASHWLRDIPSGVVLRRDVLPGLLARLETDEQRTLCVTAASQYADEAPPFRSPSHWAPFTASGLAYRR